MSPAISTKLTQLLKSNSPIISAPMTDATTPALVAAVIEAGGIGLLGTGRSSASQIVADIDASRALLPSEKQHLVGVGFVGWVLDRSGPELVQAALDKEVSVVLFAYGRNLGKHIAQVRAYDATRDHKTLVFVTVNTVEEATWVARELQPDVLVVQGYEAGGRASVDSPPTQGFVRSVVKAIPDGPLIVAAGGVANGAHVAALLKAGAAGVIVGTRFLLTPECSMSDNAKRLLAEATADSTKRSPVFDVIFPDGVWPDGIQARCLKTGIVEYETRLETLSAKPEGAKELEALKQELKAKIASDKDYPLVYAGLGVADLKEIQPASDILQCLHAETVEALNTLEPSLLVVG